MGWFDIEPTKPTMDNIENYIKANFEDYVREHSINGLSELMQRVYIEGCFSESDEEVLVDAALDLVRADLSVMNNLVYIKDIYSRICVDKSSNEDLEVFKQYVKVSIERIDFCNNFGCGIKILNAFDDTEVALEYLKFITSNKAILKETPDSRLSRLMEYLPQARKLYIRDRQFLSAAMDLVNGIEPSILKYGTDEEIDAYIYKVVAEDKKANGVYDIDERRFADVAPLLERLDYMLNLCETNISILQNKIDELNAIVINGKTALSVEALNQLKTISTKLELQKSEVEKDYRKILEEKRQELVVDKQALVNLIELEGKRQLQLITDLADKFQLVFPTQEARIKAIGEEQEKKLQAFLNSNKELSSAIAKLQTDQEFISQMEGLRATAKILEERTGNLPQVVQATNEVVVQRIEDIPADEAESQYNFYFDESIPFAKRWKKFIEAKAADEAKNGTIYHEKFLTVAKYVIMGKKPPYLYGPSGCGKTFMIKQLAKLLGLEIVTTGYISYEQDIIGYTNAGTGAYVKSNCYRCYKFGKILFLDELDNGIASATVVLNNFIGDSSKSYCFPSGEDVKKHNNFRMITAGNTNGNGKTSEHNTRQKIEESVMQRLEPIEVGYDNRVEQAILSDYTDWFEFAVAFRTAVENLSQGYTVNTAGTFTTRDASDIKAYLDANIGFKPKEIPFTPEDIMDTEFVQTKDARYLSSIEDEIDQMRLSSGAQNLYKVFKKVADKRIQG